MFSILYIISNETVGKTHVDQFNTSKMLKHVHCAYRFSSWNTTLVYTCTDGWFNSSNQRWIFFLNTFEMNSPIRVQIFLSVVKYFMTFFSLFMHFSSIMIGLYTKMSLTYTLICSLIAHHSPPHICIVVMMESAG